MRKDATSSTKSFILAAGHNHLELVQWIVGHCPEVKQGSYFLLKALFSKAYIGLYFALMNDAQEVISYLMTQFNLNRRYCYYGNVINYGKVIMGQQSPGHFKYTDYQAGVYNRNYEEQQNLGRMIEKILNLNE
jgi:hypothetical protein